MEIGDEFSVVGFTNEGCAVLVKILFALIGGTVCL